MNIISTIKALPLLGILATSLTLTPALVYADNNQHKPHKDTKHAYSQQYAHNEQYRHNDYRPHKHHQHRVAYSQDWEVNHIHRHVVAMPYVEQYTIDYDNSYLLQRQLESDQVRFVFGMRADNFDIYIHQ